MYYRIGDRVKIEAGRKPNVWVGMTGKLAHIYPPNIARCRPWGYGIELDEVDAHGKTKVIMITTRPQLKHRLLTKLEDSTLHPKYININHKKFKFNNL